MSGRPKDDARNASSVLAANRAKFSNIGLLEPESGAGIQG